MLKVHIKKQLSDFCLKIDLEQESEYLGILGASGSGKSMTLKCIAGIETPDEGSILLNGRVLFDSGKKINLPPQIRKIGYMFQNYALFPNMTVEENIGVGIADKKERKQKTAQQMARFQLTGLEKHYPAQLSGGQQQRAALARMMSHEPELILLDEPFSAMDGYLKEKLQQEMTEYLKDYPGGVLLVSHNREDIYRFCPQVCAIDDGRVLQKGSLKEVFQHPENDRVARLVGCRNLSPVKKTGDQELYASDWDLTLRTRQKIGEDIRYVGIHAQEIRCAGNDAQDTQYAGNDAHGINCFCMELTDVMESPFTYRYQLKAAGSSAAKAIWWETAGNSADAVTPESFPRRLCLPADKLLLLKEAETAGKGSVTESPDKRT